MKMKYSTQGRNYSAGVEIALVLLIFVTYIAFYAVLQP